MFQNYNSTMSEQINDTGIEAEFGPVERGN